MLMLGLAGALVMAFASTASPSPEPSAPTPAPEHAIAIYDYAAVTAPCAIDWTVLGGVAGVASNHGNPDPNGEPSTSISDIGTSAPQIIGPPLDGTEGRALVPDSDRGQLDLDNTIDHAVGPFQFIPETWEIYGTDGNGDGVEDPQNFWDAAASAAAMLCDKGVEDNLDLALTHYFGTDEWNEWADRRRGELIEYRRHQAELMADMPTPVLDRIAAVEVSQTPSAASAATVEAPAIPAPAAADWFAPAHELLLGNWDGGAEVTAGAFEITPTGGRFVQADERGRPYGRPLPIDHLLLEVDLNQLVLRPFVGDWDSDGRDTPGIVILTNGTGRIVLFDRFGDVFEDIDLGPTDPLSVSFEVVSGPPARDGPASAFVREVTAHDGSTVRLFKVGTITVAESLAQPLSDLLGAAAADGVELDGWGWRSHQQQVELRKQNCADVWTTPASACSPPTAVPGTSRHEFGLAIDFHIDGSTITADSAAFIWLQEHAGTYGLQNLPSEPWHWSIDGG